MAGPEASSHQRRTLSRSNSGSGSGSASSSCCSNVVFLHPDLGIGGAERLVVDAALALKSRGHAVHIVTAHHDNKHCFQETSDGTLAVTAVGDWLPRSIAGKCYALCAYFRMIYASLYLCLFSPLRPSTIVCDQISACIPVLRWLSPARIVFYCHFPDQLLTQRKSWIKKLYRGPLDYLEEVTTGLADCVLVNSEFTKGVFNATFRRLNHVDPGVLYPSLNVAQFDLQGMPSRARDAVQFLSINRFERKKNLGLAIRAFASLRERSSPAVTSKMKLIVAGGYDTRVTENIEYLRELEHLRDRLHLTEEHVEFRKSLSFEDKTRLLHSCHALIYTPSGEHFGIVPLEAMYCRLPVIAVNDGGPTETVVDKVTGFLCQPNHDDFSEAMEFFTPSGSEEDLVERMGEAGRRRVLQNFSFDAFAQKLDSIVRQDQRDDEGPSSTNGNKKRQ